MRYTVAMHNLVLYRKYRPNVWEEVVGQEHIVSALSLSAEKATFAHAYLFTGSRGTGKTSVARIFARSLGVSADDIIEIDAASNRGVEDIDTLRANVRTMPFSSPYKVYIIDEVHMLSNHAFNALLKTLEEPPSHVIFILATTELDKVPDTIISRCQLFSFRKPNPRILADRVLAVAASEGLAIDKESADLIAFLGDGSFRDTYGVLQKVASSVKDRKITIEAVENATGAPSLTLTTTLFKALFANDIDLAYKTLQDAETHHTDMKLLAELLLKTIRTMLMYRYSPKLRSQIEGDYGESYLALIQEGAAASNAVSSRSILALITAVERISYASVPTIPLELAFLEMLGVEGK